MPKKPEDWTDEERAAVGKVFFDDMVEMRGRYFDAANGWGRWTIATLFAVNAAIAVAVRDNIDSSWDRTVLAVMFGCIILAGAAAWLNWSLGFRYYEARANANLVLDIEYDSSNKENRETHNQRLKFWMDLTYVSTQLLALVSGCAAITALLTLL